MDSLSGLHEDLRRFCLLPGGECDRWVSFQSLPKSRCKMITILKAFNLFWCSPFPRFSSFLPSGDYAQRRADGAYIRWVRPHHFSHIWFLSTSPRCGFLFYITNWIHFRCSMTLRVERISRCPSLHEKINVKENECHWREEFFIYTLTSNASCCITFILIKFKSSFI